MTAQSPKGINFVCDAAGCSSVFTVGVVDRILRAGIAICATAGTSSGGIIAAAIATGHGAELREVWSELLGTPIFQARRAAERRWPFTLSEVTRNVLERYLGTRTMADADLPLAIVVSQLSGGALRSRTVTRGDRIPLVDVLLATTFIPGPFHIGPRIDGKLTIDGGFTNPVPVDEVQKLSSALTVVCMASRFNHRRSRPWRSAQGAVVEIVPSEPVPVGYLDFNREHSLAGMALGARAAEQFLLANERRLADACS